MTWDVSVHKYKYSQDSRRRILRKLWKGGFIVLRRVTKTHYEYVIPNTEAMDEYKKRAGLNKKQNPLFSETWRQL